MTDPTLARLAHIRALMLGSSQYPPVQHLAYLEQVGPQAGAGLEPVAVADLVLRELDPVAERLEIIRIVAETLLAFGQVGRVLAPAGVNTVPAGLIAAELVWFGLERDGVLVGAHGGFFWSPSLWVRRFYAITPNPYPWDVHFAIESHVYAHLWDQGMRQAMIQIPAGTPNLEERLAGGWVPSHEMHFHHNPRPFIWLRRDFDSRPRLPGRARPSAGAGWQVEVAGTITRELGPDDLEAAARLLAVSVAGCRREPREAEVLWRRWRRDGSALLGSFTAEGVLFSLRVVERLDDGSWSVRAVAHRVDFGSPGWRASLAGFAAWMQAMGISEVRLVVSPDPTTGQREVPAGEWGGTPAEWGLTHTRENLVRLAQGRPL